MSDEIFEVPSTIPLETGRSHLKICHLHNILYLRETCAWPTCECSVSHSQNRTVYASRLFVTATMSFYLLNTVKHVSAQHSRYFWASYISLIDCQRGYILWWHATAILTPPHTPNLVDYFVLIAVCISSTQWQINCLGYPFFLSPSTACRKRGLILSAHLEVKASRIGSANWFACGWG